MVARLRARFLAIPSRSQVPPIHEPIIRELSAGNIRSSLEEPLQLLPEPPGQSGWQEEVIHLWVIG